MGIFCYPFMQIVEDVQKEMRESSDESAVEWKYKRRVNHIYQFDIPSRYEWDWLRTAGTINTYTSYSTGTVAVTNGSTAVTLSTAGTWSTTSVFNKLKISGDDHVYAASAVAANSCTISPSFYGDTTTASNYTM